MTERQKAERRTVIANNKAMKAANEVRRKWLSTLLARKSVEGAARYVAETMVSRPYFLSRWTQKDAPLLDSLLGTTTSRHDLAVVPPSANDSKCVVYALAAIAAAHESEITHESWRHNDASTARWFGFLRTVGYDLDPVEQMVVDKLRGAVPEDDERNTDAPLHGPH